MNTLNVDLNVTKEFNIWNDILNKSYVDVDNALMVTVDAVR